MQFLYPLLKGKPPRPEKVTEFEARMVECLDQIENVWLKDDKLFLTGSKISVADLIGACEIEQPSKFFIYASIFNKYQKILINKFF